MPENRFETTTFAQERGSVPRVLSRLFAPVFLFVLLAPKAPAAPRLPWKMPVGNYVTVDGKGYLAIRPGGRVYVRRDGEARFTLYRTKVRASVRNEYWLERLGDGQRSASPGAETAPGETAASETETAAGETTAEPIDSQTKPDDADTEPPPGTASEPSFFERLFGRKKSDETDAGAQAAAAAAQEKLDEIEEKLATGWFSDCTRMVFVFEADHLAVLIFDEEELTGHLQFRPIRYRLAVPDHKSRR